MAQRSLPQAGTVVGDSGPYSSDEWAEYFQTVFTGDQYATQGPIRHFLNELEVTEAALAVTTATGAGFVYGHFLINDAALVINIALAAAGLERYDRVVMVENNTNVVYPTNLARPAAYAAGIPRNSARIAILQGTEAGAAVLPPLLTGPNYYMVELAQYLVTDAAVGSIVDYRDYCGMGVSEPSTQYIFVPVLGGYNDTTAAAMTLTGRSDGLSLEMPVDEDCRGWGRFTTPGNYLSTMTVRAVIYAVNSANIYARNIAHIGTCGIAADAVVDSSALGTEAYISPLLGCMRSFALSPLEQGDIILLLFYRQGTNVADTLSDVDHLGWLVSYTTLT